MDMDSISQVIVDKLSPMPKPRWIVTVGLLGLFFVRILVSKSHHLIAYCLSVYLVHGFILFATPKDENIPDPFEADDSEYAPANIDNNLRPFVRNMPEFSYWSFCTKLIIGSIILSFFSFTDIPVYTPILVIYFIFMIFATIIKLWQHSSKYNYNPFNFTKNFRKE